MVNKNHRPGVTLVELGDILPAPGRLVEALAAIYGSTSGATVMSATILIYFSVVGFFDGYVGTRSWLQLCWWQFAEADAETRRPDREIDLSSSDGVIVLWILILGFRTSKLSLIVQGP